MRASGSRAYKEVTLQQLRSFCETARLGSFKAASVSLGLAQPTVWAQVHALERYFEAKLIEPNGRGCRLTLLGKDLLELAGPLLTGIGSLKRALQEHATHGRAGLRVATPPRILLEDLPSCIVEFEHSHPDVRLTFHEMDDTDVVPAVQTGRADLGLTTNPATADKGTGVSLEECYELEVMLVTPGDHPLARRRQVSLDDLGRYPLVNAPDAIGVPVVKALLDSRNVFENPTRRVEAFHVASITRYVEAGFGIGLVIRLPSHAAAPGLHERPLTEHFGRVAVYLVSRKGDLQTDALRDFAAALRRLAKP
jgi:DNA-binding transcriptional LysR family regulator